VCASGGISTVTGNLVMELGNYTVIRRHGDHVIGQAIGEEPRWRRRVRMAKGTTAGLAYSEPDNLLLQDGLHPNLREDKKILRI